MSESFGREKRLFGPAVMLSHDRIQRVAGDCKSASFITEHPSPASRAEEVSRFCPVECDRTGPCDYNDARLTCEGCLESDPGVGLHENIFQWKFLLESGCEDCVDELGPIHSTAGAGNAENDILQRFRRASHLLAAHSHTFEEHICRALDPGNLEMARTGVTFRDNGPVQADDQSIGLGTAAVDSYHVPDLFRHQLPLRAKVVDKSRNASQIIKKRHEKQKAGCSKTRLASALGGGNPFSLP